MQERCRLISESQWREYQELVQKMHKLTELSQEGNELNAKLAVEYLKLVKRLKEAEKVIKHYDKKDPHYTLEDGTVMGNGYAHKYLLKWGVK